MDVDCDGLDYKCKVRKPFLIAKESMTDSVYVNDRATQMVKQTPTSVLWPHTRCHSL